MAEEGWREPQPRLVAPPLARARPERASVHAKLPARGAARGGPRGDGLALSAASEVEVLPSAADPGERPDGAHRAVDLEIQTAAAEARGVPVPGIDPGGCLAGPVHRARGHQAEAVE